MIIIPCVVKCCISLGKYLCGSSAYFFKLLFICYFLFFLSLCIVYGIICIPIYIFFKKTLHYLISQLLIAFVQIIICPLPFRIKRLKKGMPFLHNQLFSQIGTFVGVFILFCSMLISTSHINASSTKLKFHLLLVPFIFLLAIFICF